jgi:flagella basal body P-ring formation protein FlgA
MNSINPQRLELRLLATVLMIASLPLFAALASAQENAPRLTLPADIDRAVAEFTGAQIGEVGGARLPADRRLRLAACAEPLDVGWHGRTQGTVAVECKGPQSWRIFIATRPAQSASGAATGPAVMRGDPITVMVRGRGFTIQQSGEAMESGTVGEWIAVRTDARPGARSGTRGEAIRARIERPGLAVIPAG